jgi:hypothetical protein
MSTAPAKTWSVQYRPRSELGARPKPTARAATYHPQLAQMLERSFGLSHSDSRPNGISSLVNDFFTAQIQIFSTLMAMETIAAGEPRATGLTR